MEQLSVKQVAELVLEFLEVAAPQLECIVITNGESDQLNEATGELTTKILSVKDTLAMWMQLPDSSCSPMFVGWLIANGINVRQTTPATVEKAVCVALTGSEKNVMIDWVGDLDKNAKPN